MYTANKIKTFPIQFETIHLISLFTKTAITWLSVISKLSTTLSTLSAGSKEHVSCLHTAVQSDQRKEM